MPTPARYPLCRRSPAAKAASTASPDCHRHIELKSKNPSKVFQKVHQKAHQKVHQKVHQKSPTPLHLPSFLYFTTITIVVVLVLFAASNMMGVVQACMQTTTSSSTTTSTCSLSRTCSSGQPANSANLIIDADPSENFAAGLLGTCTCAASGSSPLEYVFAVNPANMVPPSSTNNAFIFCANQENFCACDVNCDCYVHYGTQVVAGNTQAYTVPVCDSGGCFHYLDVLCTDALDANSGVQNIVTGAKFSCADRFADPTDANTEFVVNSASPYPKVFYIGCKGCTVGQADIATCNGGTAGTFMSV